MNNASIVSCGAFRWGVRCRSSRTAAGDVRGSIDIRTPTLAHLGPLDTVPEPGAHGALSIGTWGKSTSASDRCAVSLASRMLDRVPEGMGIDAEGRDGAKGHHASRARQRAEGVGQPMSQNLFALYDMSLIAEQRLDALLGSWTSSAP